MKKLFVEIADSSIKREHGLMGRKSIGKNEGMLFKFPHKNNLSFWMKNTYIPLDIAFIDDDGKILQIETMNALSTRTTTAQVPCRYALEVNSGWFKENNIGVGGQIRNLNICEKSKRYAQMVTPLPDQALLPENAMPENARHEANPPVNPEIQLNMSIRSKLDYATNYNLPVMIVYRTLNGNTLPPRKLLPIPGEGYPIVSGKNGYQFKAWDASPTISGLGIEIEGGHPKSFMLDGVISLEILDEGKNQKAQEIKQQEKIMKTSFNLSRFKKSAFYNDGKGLVQKQTRAYMNCYKAKMDKGMSAHDAWQSCLEEYQKANTSDWGTKYANSQTKTKKIKR